MNISVIGQYQYISSLSANTIYGLGYIQRHVYVEYNIPRPVVTSLVVFVCPVINCTQIDIEMV